jgi:mRNA interferase MazF
MYKKGTVILVPFPFTDLSGNKVRPALIISKEKIGVDVIVVFITSQNKPNEKHLVPILPEKLNGLKTKSNIVCSKIATLDSKIVLGELGVLSSDVQKKVDMEIRRVLGV